MHSIDLAILVAWVAFWIYWLVASMGVERGRGRWTHFAGVRVAALVIVLLLVRSRAVTVQMVTDNLFLEGIGLAMFASGLTLAIWARICLGRNWGTPMSQKVDPELVTAGPYRRIRHPIYAGIVLAMLGTAVAVSWYWLIAVVLVGAYFLYSTVMEERYMAQRFPGTYPDYQRATKMLIPFVL